VSKNRSAERGLHSIPNPKRGKGVSKKEGLTKEARSPLFVVKQKERFTKIFCGKSSVPPSTQERGKSKIRVFHR